MLTGWWAQCYKHVNSSVVDTILIKKKAFCGN